MTAPIEEVSSLPGKKVSDQEENTIGKIKEIYAIDGDGQAVWVTVEASFGMGNKRTVFIPLARLKDEDGELRVPYSKDHIEQTPRGRRERGNLRRV
jgi:PRC-barrel domain